MRIFSLLAVIIRNLLFFNELPKRRKMEEKKINSMHIHDLMLAEHQRGQIMQIETKGELRTFFKWNNIRLKQNVNRKTHQIFMFYHVFKEIKPHRIVDVPVFLRLSHSSSPEVAVILNMVLFICMHVFMPLWHRHVSEGNMKYYFIFLALL